MVAPDLEMTFDGPRTHRCRRGRICAGMNGEPGRRSRIPTPGDDRHPFRRGDIDVDDSPAQRRALRHLLVRRNALLRPLRRLFVVDLSYRRVRTRFRRNLGGRAACGTREQRVTRSQLFQGGPCLDAQHRGSNQAIMMAQLAPRPVQVGLGARGAPTGEYDACVPIPRLRARGRSPDRAPASERRRPHRCETDTS